MIRSLKERMVRAALKLLKNLGILPRRRYVKKSAISPSDGVLQMSIFDFMEK